MNGTAIHKRRLQGNQAKGETFKGLDLSNMEAYGAHWIGCTFEDCDISLANLSGTGSIEECTFINCDLKMTSFRASAIRLTKFSGCDLRKSSFMGCSPLADSVFDDCKMQYSGFFEASVYRTNFTNCNLHGADLRFIEASGNNFTGSNLWNVSVNIGCQFFSSVFDERSVELWAAIAARVHPDPEAARILREVSGKHYALATRLMGSPQDRVQEGAP